MRVKIFSFPYHIWNVDLSVWKDSGRPIWERKFLWFPLFLHNDIIWLEWVTVSWVWRSNGKQVKRFRTGTSFHGSSNPNKVLK